VASRIRTLGMPVGRHGTKQRADEFRPALSLAKPVAPVAWSVGASATARERSATCREPQSVVAECGAVSRLAWPTGPMPLPMANPSANGHDREGATRRCGRSGPSRMVAVRCSIHAIKVPLHHWRGADHRWARHDSVSRPRNPYRRPWSRRTADGRRGIRGKSQTHPLVVRLRSAAISMLNSGRPLSVRTSIKGTPMRRVR
jgi:hypothetical protein